MLDSFFTRRVGISCCVSVRAILFEGAMFSMSEDMNVVILRDLLNARIGREFVSNRCRSISLKVTRARARPGLRFEIFTELRARI